MRKHQFRDSIKSLLGSHTDEERDEQLKGTIAGKSSQMYCTMMHLSNSWIVTM